MTTTPADLLAAAEYFTSRQSCECDHEVGITNCIGCDIDRMARHILATVHTDDDEPVTVEWLLQNGFKHFEQPGYSYQYLMLSDHRGMFFNLDGILTLEHQVIFKNPTRGQVRQLLSAPNVEVK